MKFTPPPSASQFDQLFDQGLDLDQASLLSTQETVVRQGGIGLSHAANYVPD
jgi:hypothetical protein